jgi:hypothetical protein
MILSGPGWRSAFAEPAETLVATEEPFWGKAQGGWERATAWGLAPGRRLPATVNTSLLRVTDRHVALLEEWRRLLATPEYRAAQARPWSERRMHVMGDQDVLTALVASADFAHVPVRQLRRDIEVAHCFGPAGYPPA